MISSLLSTKLHPPHPRQEIISRPQLLSKIDAGQNGKLILISAPAGFGKTTLLTDWVTHNNTTICWLSIDEQDDDLEQFIFYFVAALRSIDISVDEIPQSFSDGKIIEFLNSIINQISSSQKRFAFVIDDYHLIKNQEIHEAFIYLLDHLPPDMLIILGTRTDPPLRLARLRARGEMIEIRAADLRFTDEDAKIFFNHIMGIELANTDLTTLTRKTEGWITGLQLAAITLQKIQDKHSFVSTFAGNDRYIADFLVDEVLFYQPSHIQNFLLETSILDHLCASLCDAVTQRSDSKNILAELAENNLFIVALDTQREWYRYHQLFTDLLYVRLKKKSTSNILELHSRASEWYQQQKLLHPAAKHAIKANDIHSLETLIQENVLALLEIGESAAFEKQLRSFQASLKQPNIWINIAHAWTSVFSGQVDIAENALQEAEGLLSGSPIDTNVENFNKPSGHILCIRAYIASLIGDASKVLKFAQESLDRLPENDHSAVAFASLMLASALSRTGNNSNAEKATLSALGVCRNIPYSHLRIDALCMLSQIQHLQGQLHKSNDTLQEAIDFSNDNIRLGKKLLPIIGFAKIRKSTILYEWNDLENALNEVNDGLELIENWGEKDNYMVGLVQKVKISEALGRYDQAFKTITKGLDVSEGLNFWSEAFDVLEAWMHAKHGKSDYVYQWLQKMDNPVNFPPSFEREFVYCHLVEILKLRGDSPRAEIVISELLPFIEQTDSTDRLIRALILYSSVLFDLNKTDEAILALSRALKLAQPEGYIRVFVDRGEAVSRLLYMCSQREIYPEYCAKILDEFTKYTQNILKTGTKSDTEFIFETLSSRELEVLQQIAEGLTNQEIGQKLHLSLFTVKSHARNIFNKLGVKNRTEAVAKARLLGML